MRNLKRVLSLAMALVMVLGMMVITTNAADFTDAEEITYKEAVEVMSSLGILNGYEAADGTYSFNPKGTLERDEAAKIIAYVAMGADLEGILAPATPAFTDIADSWAAKYINVLVNLKVVDGNGDGTYNPDGKLTVAQFAKMLLLAASVEGEFTGAEWKENVKNAFNAQPSMVATGLKITDEDPDITREEACHMALAAMKIGSEKVEYVVWDDVDGDDVIDTDEDVIESYDNARDAIMDKKLLEGTVEYKKVVTPVNLLSEVYGYSYVPATDAFGRPGDAYVKGTSQMFYADKPLATFEGPATQGALFAAAKAGSTATKIDYTIIQDGVNIDAFGDWSAVKTDAKNPTNGAAEFAAGTGYGIKSELYKEGTGAKAVYTLVAVREYLGEVTVVTPANPEVATSKRTITVTLDKVPTACEETVDFELKTEEFAKGDKVIVTMAGTTIKTIALAETVTGVVTEAVKGSGSIDTYTYTIGGEKYVMSQNSTAEVPAMDGEEYSWYVDSMGNLIGNVVDNSVAAKHYGILLGADGLLYVPATPGTLLGAAAKGQEANEVVKILTAEGKEVVFTTAWEYIDENEDGVIEGVTYINGEVVKVNHDKIAETPEVDAYRALEGTPGTLVEYTLDKDGKIDSIKAFGTDGNESGAKLENGKVQLVGTGFNKVVTDKTVFFLKVANDENTTDDKWVVYTGYKTVPNMDTFTSIFTIDGLTATGASDGTYAFVAIDGKATTPENAVAKDYIYFADLTYTAKWDASANKGQGATVYVYDNIYLNGVKTPVTFAGTLNANLKGQLYAYTTDALTGAVVLSGSNLLGEGVAVTLIHEDFFVASDVVYVDADTVYYQITKTGLVKHEVLPTVKTTQGIEVVGIRYNQVRNTSGALVNTTANTVYFKVVDVEAPLTPEQIAAKELADAKTAAIDFLKDWVKKADANTSSLSEVTAEDLADVLADEIAKFADLTTKAAVATQKTASYNALKAAAEEIQAAKVLDAGTITVTTKAAAVNDDTATIYVDTNKNAAEQKAAITAALKAAGYVNVTVDLSGKTATAVMANGFEKVFTFFSFTPNATDSKAQYCANDGIDVYMTFESNAIASGELTAVLYSGEYALAEAVFVPEAGKNYEINDGHNGTLCTCFYVNMIHDSGSWNGNNFIPSEELVPDSVGVYLNGVLYQTIEVSIADADWDALIALDGAHPECDDATCKTELELQ